MSTQFTPGPWLVTDSGTDNVGHVSSSPSGFGDIATTWRDASGANARLIAAAPDLYEALKAMVEAHGGLGVSPAMQLATAALAKVQS